MQTCALFFLMLVVTTLQASDSTAVLKVEYRLKVLSQSPLLVSVGGAIENISNETFYDVSVLTRTESHFVGRKLQPGEVVKYEFTTESMFVTPIRYEFDYKSKNEMVTLQSISYYSDPTWLYRGARVSVGSIRNASPLVTKVDMADSAIGYTIASQSDTSSGREKFPIPRDSRGRVNGDVKYVTGYEETQVTFDTPIVGMNTTRTVVLYVPIRFVSRESVRYPDWSHLVYKPVVNETPSTKAKRKVSK